MNLVSLTLKNFRCFHEEITIAFDDLTALIGENDVGKSTILEALEIFFNNRTVKLDSRDLSVAADDNYIELTCEFNELPNLLVLDAQAETSLAGEHLLTQNGNLRIRKVFNAGLVTPKEEVFVCAYHPTSEQYSDLLELTNAKLKKRLDELNIEDSSVQLSNNPSIRRAIWGSSDDLQLANTIIPVTKEGVKHIWSKLRDHLPRYALFQSDRPSRDSDSEVQDPMKLAIETALAEPEVVKKLNEVSDAVRASSLELAERTHRTLASIDENLASVLTTDFKSNPRWAGQFSLTLLSDEGIPVNKRGSGVRRLILVSFFRAAAEREIETGKVANIIYALEEPETSQHPKNQEMLLESFEDLAREPGRQVILTTHSPGFASELPTSSFRFLQTTSDGKRNVASKTETSWEEIVQTLGVTPDNRVKVLICVEGPNDVKALQCLSSALHAVDITLPDLSNDPRVAFVPLGGGTLSHWVAKNYLRDLRRPEIHIYDNDVTKYGCQVQEVNQRSDRSWATQTCKLEIENYLHPDAIQMGIGVKVTFGDCDDVPELVSQALKQDPNQKPLNTRRVKEKLADRAFPLMTADLIKQRDPKGEIEGWMRKIGEMLK